VDAKKEHTWSVRSEGYDPVPAGDGESYETKKGVRASWILVRDPRSKNGDPRSGEKYH